MPNLFHYRNSLLLSFSLSLIAAVPAQAGLGDRFQEGGYRRIESTKETKTAGKFDIQEKANGVVRTRQFVSKTGVVFGAAWTGSSENQLPGLLGHYYNDFAAYEQSQPKRGGRIPYRKINDGNVVVEIWDLPKQLRGRTYAPALLPAGVTPSSINLR